MNRIIFIIIPIIILFPKYSFSYYDYDDEEYMSASEIIIKYNAVSPYMKKLVNKTRSIEEKYNIIKVTGFTVPINTNKFNSVTIINMFSSISGEAKDKNGNIFKFRMNDFNPIDTIDTLNIRNKFHDKLTTQTKYVSDMVEKQIEDLTEDDFNNVRIYHYNEAISFLIENNHVLNKYDKTKKYIMKNFTPIKAKFKTNGIDKYGRYLVSIITDKNNFPLSFEIAKNPYLNSEFDLYKSINSNKNIERATSIYR